MNIRCSILLIPFFFSLSSTLSQGAAQSSHQKLKLTSAHNKSEDGINALIAQCAAQPQIASTTQSFLHHDLPVVEETTLVSTSPCNRPLSFSMNNNGTTIGIDTSIGADPKHDRIAVELFQQCNSITGYTCTYKTPLESSEHLVAISDDGSTCVTKDKACNLCVHTRDTHGQYTHTIVAGKELCALSADGATLATTATSHHVNVHTRNHDNRYTGTLRKIPHANAMCTNTRYPAFYSINDVDQSNSTKPDATINISIHNPNADLITHAIIPHSLPRLVDCITDNGSIISTQIIPSPEIRPTPPKICTLYSRSRECNNSYRLLHALNEPILASDGSRACSLETDPYRVSANGHTTTIYHKKEGYPFKPGSTIKGRVFPNGMSSDGCTLCSLDTLYKCTRIYRYDPATQTYQCCHTAPAGEYQMMSPDGSTCIVGDHDNRTAHIYRIAPPLTLAQHSLVHDLSDTTCTGTMFRLTPAQSAVWLSLPTKMRNALMRNNTIRVLTPESQAHAHFLMVHKNNFTDAQPDTYTPSILPMVLAERQE